MQSIELRIPDYPRIVEVGALCYIAIRMLKVVFLLFFCSVTNFANGANVMRPTTTGLYPIWENTAHVEPDGRVYLGLHSLHVGLVDRAQIGVQPVMFMYRTLNANVKALLLEGESVSLGLQVGVYHLLEGASRSSMSPNYTSRLDNPDFSLTLFPVSAVFTYQPAYWLELHQAVTAIGVTSRGPIQSEVSFAHALTAELLPLSRHSLSLHWTEIGLWTRNMRIVGMNYRYRNDWFEARAGYYYRILPEGVQGGPLVTLGFLL